MMNDALVDVLKNVVTALEAEHIAYAVTGSVASSLHGEPYASLDVDLVVQMDGRQAEGLARRLPPRFYRNPDMLRQAVLECGIANLIDMETGIKVDLSVPSADPFYQAVFQRRRKYSFGPQAPEFIVVSPEDVILMKLLWRRESRSHKQWDNALSVVHVRGDRLDWNYLFEQAARLKLDGDLQHLRDAADLPGA